MKNFVEQSNLGFMSSGTKVDLKILDRLKREENHTGSR
jgi:hypothetical protein